MSCRGFIAIKSFEDELLLRHETLSSRWLNFIKKLCRFEEPLLVRCSLTTDPYQRSRHLVLENATPCRQDDTKRIMRILSRFDSQFVFNTSQIPV